MRPSVHKFLRDALKFTNWVLLLLGLGVGLTAGYWLLHWTRARHDSLAPASPPPTPPPGQGLPASPPTSHIEHVLNTEPWFLWAFVVLGTYMSFAACVGLIGADFLNKCRCGVGFHLYLVAFALIIQFVFVILLFSDPGLIIKTPDVTGAEAKVWGVVHAHVPLARGVVIAALVVQVIDAGLAFALARSAIPAEAAESDDEYFDKHYGRRARGRSAGSSRGMGNQSDDDSDDRQISSNSTRGSSQRGRGFFGKRGGLTVPLLDSEDEDVSTSIEDGDTSNGSETETWAERMRSKYNLDTSRLTYDPERGEGGEGGDGDENRASCGIQ